MEVSPLEKQLKDMEFSGSEPSGQIDRRCTDITNPFPAELLLASIGR